MTWISPAETRREYKRTQEQHQPPRTICHGKTCRGDQPPPTERSRAPDHSPPSAGNIGATPAEDGAPTKSGRPAAEDQTEGGAHNEIYYFCKPP